MRVLTHKPTGLPFLAYRAEETGAGPGYSGALLTEGRALKACGFIPAGDLEELGEPVELLEGVGRKAEPLKTPPKPSTAKAATKTVAPAATKKKTKKAAK